MSQTSIAITNVFNRIYYSTHRKSHLIRSTSTHADSYTQVGAGPAGLVMALDLLQNGVKVRIIEKTKAVFIGQKGAGIMVNRIAIRLFCEAHSVALQPRSIELYRALGVLEDIQKLAVLELPAIKNCVVGQQDSNFLSISDMFPCIKPTSSRPYVSTNLTY